MKRTAKTQKIGLGPAERDAYYEGREDGRRDALCVPGIASMAKDWYAGLLAKAYAHFRRDLASGKYRPFTDEDGKACEAAVLSDEKYIPPEWQFERALRERFIRDEDTAHLILIASQQGDCGGADGPQTEAAEAMARDVFEFAKRPPRARRAA